MDYVRPYDQGGGYPPSLFYVVFGVEEAPLEISKSRHRVDAFPKGLEVVYVSQKTNRTYMEELLGGTLGEVLSRTYPELYPKAKKAKSWAVLRGTIRDSADLGYLKNTIGIIQALAEKGAAGVLDLLTFTMYTPAEWEEKIFNPGFRPHAHAVILSSPLEEGGLWLHTRGMMKFGRPDISVRPVPPEETDIAAGVINQMIFYSAQGAVFSKTVKLHISQTAACVLTPVLAGDGDDPDFNNAHYEIDWDACVLEE